jgi:hypothetical protein
MQFLHRSSGDSSVRIWLVRDLVREELHRLDTKKAPGWPKTWKLS